MGAQPQIIRISTQPKPGKRLHLWNFIRNIVKSIFVFSVFAISCLILEEFYSRLAVVSASPSSSAPLPHIVTVNSEGNIQRIVQQSPQPHTLQPQQTLPLQQPLQPQPQLQIIQTPSGVNQIILPTPAATPQSAAAPTQMTLRQAAPTTAPTQITLRQAAPRMLPQAIRLPNGAMAIRSK